MRLKDVCAAALWRKLCLGAMVLAMLLSCSAYAQSHSEAAQPASTTVTITPKATTLLVNGYPQYSEATCILLNDELQRVAERPDLRAAALRTIERHCQQPTAYSKTDVMPQASPQPRVYVGYEPAQDADALAAPPAQATSPSRALEPIFMAALNQLKTNVIASYHAFTPLYQLVFWLFGLALLIKVLASKLLFGSALWLGRQAEKQLARRLKHKLSNEFSHYYNLVLPTARGDLTELDHLVLSRFGLFVIEVKNHQGWVFGSETQPQWTVQRFRHKHSLPNPLWQNQKHVSALKHVLAAPLRGVTPAAVYSIVAFSRRAQFKTPLPTNVMHIADVDRYIAQQANALTPVLSDSQLAQCRQLLDNFANEAKQLRTLHLQQVRVGRG